MTLINHAQMISKETNLHHQSNSPHRWNCIVFLAGVISLFISCFFLYVRRVGIPNSLYWDWPLGIRIAISRSIFDTIFLCDIIKKLSTMLPSKINAFEKRDLNKKPKYTMSIFIIDLLAILPLPQIFLWMKIDNLSFCVMSQVPFKILSMSPYSQRATEATGILMKNAWLGALQNLFYFIMISNGLGALYYDWYTEMLMQCSITINREEYGTLDWDEMITRCTEKYGHEYGLYSDAIATKIGTRSFLQKYTYCLAWGLKNLSSFGQIINASSYTADTFLSLIIIIAGLILFGDLLARMQIALQCTEVKEDRQRTRQRMVEEWMNYHQLPQPLKKQVKQAIQSEWSTTRGINDETILDSLPWNIRSDIRRHLYLEIIRTMPLFEDMDDDLLNAICAYLRAFSSNEGTYVTFEGEPVHQLLFVFSGQLEVSNAKDAGQCTTLGPGDMCGKELLEWCSRPTASTENLKTATQTVKSITDVDAFALRVDDVKLLAIQFHRDGKFRRAFQRYTA